MSNKAVRLFDKVIMNDFLFSNNVIYKAFFAPGEWSQSKLYDIIYSYNRLDPRDLDDNYFSINFGGKFYEYGLSKLIGYIRQDIEDLKPTPDRERVQYTPRFADIQYRQACQHRRALRCIYQKTDKGTPIPNEADRCQVNT